MTRQEQDYYHDISKQTQYLKRIAQALEEHTELMEQIVNKEKNDRLDRFKKAANLIYGNDATVNPDKGRSDENYTYPQSFVTTAALDTQSEGQFAGFKPNIDNELDQRMYNESQQLTGGEFKGWFDKLNTDEKEAYSKIYSNTPDNGPVK